MKAILGNKCLLLHLHKKPTVYNKKNCQTKKKKEEKYNHKQTYNVCDCLQLYGI